MGSSRPLLVVTRLVFAFALVGTIWLSLMPLSELPSAASVSDVLSHFIGYLILGALAVISGLRPALAFVFLFTFGALLEFIQGASGYRFFELKDIVLNALGLVTGIATTVLIKRVIQARPA